MNVKWLLLSSHSVGLRLAPSFDQTHVPGCWVSSGDERDDVIVKLRQNQKIIKHINSQSLSTRIKLRSGHYFCMKTVSLSTKTH